MQETMPDNERLIDLVRYCRAYLHDEGLITDDEYAALVEIGPEAARRLERYDDIHTRHEALFEAARALVEKMDEIHEHPAYRGVLAIAAVHGAPYSGPTYEAELDNLRALIQPEDNALLSGAAPSLPPDRLHPGPRSHHRSPVDQSR